MVDFLRRLTFKQLICRTFFGLFSAVFGSFSDRFRLVSDCLRTVGHGFHTGFLVFWCCRRRDFVFVVVAIAVVVVAVVVFAIVVVAVVVVAVVVVVAMPRR